MPRKVWGEIMYPFPNINGFTIEDFEYMGNFIPDFSMEIII